MIKALLGMTPERFWVWLASLGVNGLWAVAIALVGFLGGKALRRVVQALVQRSGLEALAERVGLSRSLYAMGLHEGLASALSRLVWGAWVVLVAHVFFVQLGLPGISHLFLAILGWLPKLIVAGGLLLGGVVLADMCRRFIRAWTSQPQWRALIASGVYYTVVALSVTVAAEQLGLEVKLLHVLVQLSFAIVMGCVALGFALSAKEVFSHLLSRYYVRQMFQVGDTLIFEDGQQGEVVAFEETTLVLEQQDRQQWMIPYAELLGSSLTLRTPSSPA